MQKNKVRSANTKSDPDRRQRRTIITREGKRMYHSLINGDGPAFWSMAVRMRVSSRWSVASSAGMFCADALAPAARSRRLVAIPCEITLATEPHRICDCNIASQHGTVIWETWHTAVGTTRTLCVDGATLRWHHRAGAGAVQIRKGLISRAKRHSPP